MNLDVNVRYTARPPMMMFQFGAVIVEVHDGWTVTKIPGLDNLTARWDEQPGQAETAARIGCSVRQMNIDHDLLHSYLAEQLGLPASPALINAAGGSVTEAAVEADEEAVLALQKLLYAVGKNAFDLIG